MLGTTVRRLRRQLGLTQEALAERAQLSVRSIRDIEGSRITSPRQRTMALLADGLALRGADRERFLTRTTSAAWNDSSELRRGSPKNVDTRRSQPPVVPVPAQLPADLASFVGRRSVLRALPTLQASDDTHLRTATVVTLTGAAGVGKTALALHWAHAVTPRFPDGQLYVDLRGFHTTAAPVPPRDALAGFLEALAVPPERMPSTTQALSGLYRSLLAGKRFLVVLDNAHDPAQVQPLLPGSPGCLTVITGRDRVLGKLTTDGVPPLVLDLPSRSEARQIFTRRVGTERVAAEPATVEEVIDRCGRLPLAITLAATHAATRPGLSLQALADELPVAELPEGADRLAHGDVCADLWAAFAGSYQALTAEAAQLFRKLGKRPQPPVNLPLDRVAGAERHLLTELTRLHLLDETSAGRYTLHRLLHAFANGLTQGAAAPAARLAVPSWPSAG